MKKVVLITTGQPATNPRLVKEANALQAEGWNVTVLYCYVIDWALHEDIELLKGVSWNYQLAGGNPQQAQLKYNTTRIRNRLSLTASRFTKNGLLTERAQARCFDELLEMAKKIKADWYIGHNLGALAVSVLAARHHRTQAAFDFEDYYRGEATDNSRAIFLENKYVPQLDLIIASSPLITEKVRADFPGLRNVITMRNCLPLTDQPPYLPKKNEAPLQLFWFSQTIGDNRGIECLFQAIALLKDEKIKVTLAGRCTAHIKELWESYPEAIKNRIHFAGVIPPGDLPVFASRFHVGLALETGFSINNSLALSNKIFTYLLAGNAVIFTATPMQQKFNLQYEAGTLLPDFTAANLAEAIRGFMDETNLEAQRQHNYALCKTVLNYEQESEKLLSALNINDRMEAKQV